MNKVMNWNVLRAIAFRTFRNYVESPIAYIFAIFFFGFVGGFFTPSFFQFNNASIQGIAQIAPWGLLLMIPALTMGLISEEIRSGTFEHLATLPIRDWEIVLGKYFGFALLGFLFILGLGLYPAIISFIAHEKVGFDWGASVGILVGLYMMILAYGAMGLFASSLAKNQVVALIFGIIFCCFFFFIGQIYAVLPGFLSSLAEFLGVLSHMHSIARGVFDIRDFLYFFSLTFVFLYLVVQYLNARRF